MKRAGVQDVAADAQAARKAEILEQLAGQRARILRRQDRPGAFPRSLLMRAVVEHPQLLVIAVGLAARALGLRKAPKGNALAELALRCARALRRVG
ncbi:MAG TPA: hypothetical protein VF265_10055 [Nevskiaceae bacterium]